jgi:outer membrane receptor protein involved in Fe transport
VSGLPCGFSVIVNGGEVIGEGAELEVVAEPFDAWRINLAIAYNESEFESVVPGTGYSPGQRLPDAPRVNGSIGLQRALRLGGAWSGFVRADYTYVGDVVSQFGPIDEFDTTGLRASFARGGLELELFGRNIFDERGVLTLQDPAFGAHQTLLRPREIGVEIRYDFN